MTLGELIAELKREPLEKIVQFGFGYPHSYRGYYEQLAFEPMENVSVAQMLHDAETAIGKTYRGYKGGDYEMDKDTDVWLAEYGCCGEALSRYALAFMLGRSRP